MNYPEFRYWLSDICTKSRFPNSFSEEIKTLSLRYSPIKAEKTSQNLYHIFYDINEIPLCLHCKKETTRFWGFHKGYSTYCSYSCASNNDLIKENRKKLFMMKHGVDNMMKINDSIVRRKKTVKEKYGVESVFQLDSFKEKRKRTSLQRFGVEHPSQSKLIKEKTKETCFSRYGGHPNQSSLFFKLHGNKRYKKKKYIMPSGNIIQIQGCENFCLDYLLKTFDETDIIIGNKLIEKEIGKIFYDQDNKQKRYFPDIYIKSENRIIEVKSWYTYNGEGKNSNLFKTNLLKKYGTIKKGLAFNFFIYNRKNKLFIL